MSYQTSTMANLGLPEIRIDSIEFWRPLMFTHFPEFKDGNHSTKWVERFRFSPSEEAEVVKITDYDIKRSSGMFFELVEGGKAGYSYRNKHERVLYYYNFSQEDIDKNYLHPTGWTHSTKGSETGYVFKVSNLLEVSRQSLTVIKADPSAISGWAVGIIKKNSGISSNAGFVAGQLPKTEPGKYDGYKSDQKPAFSAIGFDHTQNLKSFHEDAPKNHLTKSSEMRIPHEPDSNSDTEDDHVSKLTIRDKYCMMHRLPKTNKPWLNSLINEHNRECPQ
jgi:hypothetical protein